MSDLDQNPVLSERESSQLGICWLDSIRSFLASFGQQPEHHASAGARQKAWAAEMWAAMQPEWQLPGRFKKRLLSPTSPRTHSEVPHKQVPNKLTRAHPTSWALSPSGPASLFISQQPTGRHHAGAMNSGRREEKAGVAQARHGPTTTMF